MFMKIRQVRRAIPFLGIVTLLALVVAHGVQMGSVQAAAPTETTPNLKVAFLGDLGLSGNAQAVLQLVQAEGADMVLHQGDFGYNETDSLTPTNWDDQITSILGVNYPYFGSVGNHDVGQWADYQQLLQARLDRVAGATCTGDLGVQSICHYNGLFFILSGAGTMGTGHGDYLRDQLALDDSVWSICSWHKNQNSMQVGSKSNAVGWSPYEECRLGGGIIATGHEHSYERTKTLSNTQFQTVDPLWADPDVLRVGGGSTFVFVSGISGQSIRNQDRCLPTAYPYGCNQEWASIYASDQGARPGALFIEFHVDGDPDKARGYFKNIDGVTIDDFTIVSDLNNTVPPTPAPPSGLTGTAVSTSQIDLNWTDASTDEDGFQIERSPDGVTSWTQVASVGADVTAHSNNGLVSSTAYFYRVRAFNASGDSSYSNLASSSTLSAAGEATLIFQEGEGGYTGTVDTHIKEGAPASSFGSLGAVEWDTVATEANNLPKIGLMRFDNLFGPADGQIPAGATIQSATLAYSIFDAGDPANLHEITIDWPEDVTFNSFGDNSGVQPAEYGTLVGAGTAVVGNNQVDVTASLVLWSTDPTSNHGWLFLPTGGNGADLRSKEYGTVLERPKLTVVYIAALPTVRMTATDAAASESGTDLGSFDLTRTGDTALALAVQLSIAGSASNGADYQTISSTATIPAGSVSIIITVTPIEDAEVESQETVILTVVTDAAYNVGMPGSGVVTITSDDLAPTFVDNQALSEVTSSGVTLGDLINTFASDDTAETLTEELYGGKKRSRLQHQWTFDVTGGNTVTFFVEAHHNSSVEDFLFEYSPDGSAWTPMLTITKTADDNMAQAFELPASTSGALFVRTKDTDRSRPEGTADSLFVDHMFVRSMSGAGLPQTTLAVTDGSADEAGPDSGAMTVIRTGDTAENLVLAYSIGGTADNGTDYQGLSGTVVILAGQNSASIMVIPMDDAESEGTESVALTLSPDPGHSIGSPSNGTVTIADDEPVDVKDRAVTDTSMDGTLVSGDFYSTHSSDNVYEAIREELYRGNKHSRLEHRWTFNVTGGSTVTFFVEAWHDSTAEDFWFEYSTDQLTWTSMLTIMDSADADAAQSSSLPSSIVGLVYVRVVDTDRTRGENSADTIFIDDMFIRSQS